MRNVIFIRAACLLWLLEPAVCFLAAVFYPEIISSDFLVDSLKLFIYEFLKCKSDLSLESIAFGNFMDLERRRTRKTSTKKQVALEKPHREQRKHREWREKHCVINNVNREI